jgi:phosphatidyl-myo-inositol alpha-mannosyltransferase
MKIALLCDDTLDTTDGVQQYVLTLGAWLAAQGHEVHYLTSTTTRTDLPNVHSLAKRIKTQFNSNHGGMPLPASRGKIRELLRREQFDIIHIQMPYSPLLAGQVVSLAPKSTQVIGTFHIFPQNKLVSVATKALGLWVHRQLPRFHSVISVSTAAQTFARQAFGIETVVVPNMLDIHKFPAPKSHKPGDKIKVLFLGRLVERKGSIYLLQAISALLQDYPDLGDTITVAVAGKGPLLSDLEDYVATHNLQSIVSFLGFIAEADKPKLLSSADIAVFPSTGGESFGISLIEAMSATPGPVIAGDNPGYRTVMSGAEQQVISPKESRLFAELLYAYIVDPDARRAAHVWQTTHVKQYDTPIVGKQVLSIYKRALHDASK